MGASSMTRREREARRWWRQARRDLESAEINAQHDRHEVACFLCQQAAEKALKAFLYAQGEGPVLGHSLLDLTQRAAAYTAALAALRPAAKTLDGYYIPSRYPNGLTDDVAPVDFFDADDSGRGRTAARAILDALATVLPAAVTAP
jgi:HEPN domain-containing protein